MHTIAELYSCRVERLFLIALHLNLTFDVEVAEYFDEVGIGQARVLWDIVDEAKELFGRFTSFIAQAHVSDIGHGG